MKVFRTGDGILVRLEKGEEIVASLVDLARREGIRGGVVQGLGAVSDSELGFFRPEDREYDRFQVPEVCEILSLNGNLSMVDGRPFLHAHLALLPRDRKPIGGHLFRSTIAVTGEFFVQATDLRLTRVLDPGIGLPLLEAE